MWLKSYSCDPFASRSLWSQVGSLLGSIAGNELSRAAFRARAWYFCHGTSQEGLLGMRTRIIPLIENAGEGLHARIGGKAIGSSRPRGDNQELSSGSSQESHLRALESVRAASLSPLRFTTERLVRPGQPERRLAACPTRELKRAPSGQSCRQLPSSRFGYCEPRPRERSSNLCPIP